MSLKKSPSNTPPSILDHTPKRDFIGYGAHLPNPQWPENSLIAVNFNLNIEAGGESCILDGDDASEGILNDIGMPPYSGYRTPLTESVFEYGSRRGAWRVLEIFHEYNIPLSILAIAKAFERNPELAHACVAEGHEIASHGLRWIDYTTIPAEVERAHITEAIDILTRLTGTRPQGWMTGRPSINTRQLAVEAGGFLYDRDSLSDELPYWLDLGEKHHLVIPYSLETNDNRCSESQGFSTADDFFFYMRDAFDTLYQEGQKGSPKLLSIGLHDRLIGRPGRSKGLKRLLEYMRKFDRIWYCRGIDVAHHWKATFPPARDR